MPPPAILLLATLAMAAVAAAAAAIENPTGSCQADVDGGRVGYHSPGAGDTYLPDCSAPLDLEYWRVFAVDPSHAYIIPRPDAAGLRYGFCGDAGGILMPLFERYGLCAETVTDPSVINRMAIGDALNITHALHERLIFAGCEDGVSPFTPRGDVLAACGLMSSADAQDYGLMSSADAQDYCDSVRGLCSPDGICKEMAVQPSAAVARAIAGAINQLYNIDESEKGRMPSLCSAVASLGRACLLGGWAALAAAALAAPHLAASLMP